MLSIYFLFYVYLTVVKTGYSGTTWENISDFAELLTIPPVG